MAHARHLQHQTCKPQGDLLATTRYHHGDRGWRDRQEESALPACHEMWLLGTMVAISHHLPPVGVQAVKRFM